MYELFSNNVTISALKKAGFSIASIEPDFYLTTISIDGNSIHGHFKTEDGKTYLHSLSEDIDNKGKYVIKKLFENFKNLRIISDEDLHYCQLIEDHDIFDAEIQKKTTSFRDSII